MPEATPTADPAQTAGDPPATPGGTKDTPDLGDAGKKALEEERTARRNAEKAAKAAQAELDKLREASMSEQEKAVALARAEGRSEAFKQANDRLLRAEVRAAAGGKLADPDDAAHLLDLESFVNDKGDIDTKAITSAIDELIQAKPYLASGRPARGGGEGGPRGGTAPKEFNGNDWLRQLAAGTR